MTKPWVLQVVEASESVEGRAGPTTLASGQDTTSWNKAVTPAGLTQRIKQGGTLPLGTLMLLPFRNSELPEGWYPANGSRFLLTSDEGKVLNTLSSSYKADWGITVTGSPSTINVPNLYHTDGRGMFMRPGGAPGTRVDDAIRNITGGSFMSNTSFFGSAYRDGYSHGYGGGGTSKYIAGLSFNAANQVPTASENRPLHVQLTPAIFLGLSVEMTTYVDNFWDASHPLKPFTHSMTVISGSIVASNAVRQSSAVGTPPTERWYAWSGSAWILIEDHRGKSGWVNGVATTITDFGPLPDGWSTTPPVDTEPDDPLEKAELFKTNVTAILDNLAIEQGWDSITEARLASLLPDSDPNHADGVRANEIYTQMWAVADVLVEEIKAGQLTVAEAMELLPDIVW